MAVSNAWTTLTERTVYKNRWIRVREDQFVLPNGETGIYGVVEIRPSIGVVAVNENGEVALIGQYRYAVRRFTWEIPRGGSSEGEHDMLAVAKRELREEAGLEAARWRSIGMVDVCNGITTDIQHLFLAEDLSRVRNNPDPEEDLTLRWVTLKEAIAMVMANQITEVCSVAALLKVNVLLQSELEDHVHGIYQSI